jgi:hypothetical protein
MGKQLSSVHPQSPFPPSSSPLQTRKPIDPQASHKPLGQPQVDDDDGGESDGAARVWTRGNEPTRFSDLCIRVHPLIQGEGRDRVSVAVYQTHKAILASGACGGNPQPSNPSPVPYPHLYARKRGVSRLMSEAPTNKQPRAQTPIPKTV